MKKYITLLAGLFLTMFSYGQVIPLDYNTNLTIPNGAYVKDMNNVLEPYTGTWVGNWDGKQFTLVIEKITQRHVNFPNGEHYYIDELIGKYRIANLSDGAIIEDNLDVTDFELAKIESVGRPKNNRFNFLYSDSDLCSNSGKITLKGNPATNILTYYYTPDDFWISQDCIYNNQGSIPIPIPTVHVQLNR